MALLCWRRNFIDLVDNVTIDEAALVAASINPVEVDSSVETARIGGFDGWQKAAEIARLLRDAITSRSIHATEVHVEVSGYDYVTSQNKLRFAPKGTKPPALYIKQATFRASEVWFWLGARSLIETELLAFRINIRNKVVKKILDEHKNKLSMFSPINEPPLPLAPIIDVGAREPNYLNPSHPRFSHKLAAAIAVWEAMEDESLLQGVSTKAAMASWLADNQSLSKTGTIEVINVANWCTTGGAPKTPSGK